MLVQRSLVATAAMQAQPLQLEALQQRVRQLPPSCTTLQQGQQQACGSSMAIVLPDQCDYS